MTQNNSASRINRESLRISSVGPVGWQSASGRVPGVGEQVYCVEGPADVLKILGRTSDGSRLLELRLAGEKTPPFFAASSNVLVRSEEGDPDALARDPDVWIG